MAAKKKPSAPKLTEFDPLPKGFVLYKPLQREAYNEAAIYELGRKKRLLITRKRDGWKLFAVKENGTWKIYTDGMREITEHLPQIARELEKLKFYNRLAIENKTMLVGEGILDQDGDDNFNKVGSILNSKTAERALDGQKQYGRIKFMIFDWIFAGGYCLLDLPYGERLGRIVNSLKGRHYSYLLPVPLLPMTFQAAQELVRERKWEGLVLYDVLFTTASYRLDGGSPKRHEGCYKWKPVFEDDFIVREWIPKEDDPRAMKEVLLAQIDPETKCEIDCGKHGIFDKVTRELIHQALLAGKTLVLQMGFEQRNPSGKLRNKWFIRLRDDKRPEDCLAPCSFPQK